MVNSGACGWSILRITFFLVQYINFYLFLCCSSYPIKGSSSFTNCILSIIHEQRLIKTSYVNGYIMRELMTNIQGFSVVSFSSACLQVDVWNFVNNIYISSEVVGP